MSHLRPDKSVILYRGELHRAQPGSQGIRNDLRRYGLDNLCHRYQHTVIHGEVALTFRIQSSPPTSHPPSATGSIHLAINVVMTVPNPYRSPAYFRQRTILLSNL